LRAWKKEIEALRMIEEKVPNLLNSRIICVLHDTSRNLNQKYIVMEWLEGKNNKKIKK
jgi:hypothetical protein